MIQVPEEVYQKNWQFLGVKQIDMFRISQQKITQISKFHLLTALMHGKMHLYQLLAKQSTIAL